jgi:anti-sigma factor RsiW
MASCSEIRPLLGAYLDGELPADQRVAVGQHLEQCMDCLRELDDFARIEQIGRAAAGAPAVGEGDWDRVWRNVRAGIVPARRARAWLRPVASLAVAALLLIAIGVGYILVSGGRVAAGPAWEVKSVESGSPDVSVGVSYYADVAVIWAVTSPEDDGGEEDDTT